MAEITLDWPTATLTPEQWLERVEALAEQAEEMIGRKHVSLQAQCRLAVEFVGLLWPALSAEVVAGSCRASLLLGAPGVILSSAPADQLQEIAERLDAIWEAAHADPATAVVDGGVLLVELPPGVHRPKGRPPRQPAQEPEPLEPAADPDELPADWVEPVEPPAAPAPEPLEPDPEPEPMPPPPADWLSSADVCELLGVTARAVADIRDGGKFGAEGEGWGHDGSGYRYNPDAVEQLMADIPPGLDALLGEVQAT